MLRRYNLSYPAAVLLILSVLSLPADRKRQKIGNGQADKMGNEIAPLKGYIHVAQYMGLSTIGRKASPPS